MSAARGRDTPRPIARDLLDDEDEVAGKMTVPFRETL